MEQRMVQSKRRPSVRVVKASEARQQWSNLLNSVFRGETRVVVEKSGIPVAAIVSAEDLRRLEGLEERRREDFEALEATWRVFQDVPDEEIEREVGRAIREAREARRRTKEAEKPGINSIDSSEQVERLSKGA